MFHSVVVGQRPGDAASMVNDDVQKVFGRRVKALLRGRGLSQEQLSEAISRSPDTVSNIERGFAATRLSTAAEIARVLGVRLADLFDFGTERPVDTIDRARQDVLDRLAATLADADLATLRAIATIAASIVALNPPKAAAMTRRRKTNSPRKS